MALRGAGRCWRREVGDTRMDGGYGRAMLTQWTGNRAVVQVFEGTSGIDVKRVGFL